MKASHILAVIAALAGAACASAPNEIEPADWSATWTASPTPPTPTARTFENVTIRQVVSVSAGGQRVRVRLTNEYGEKPLRVGAASLALAAPDGAPAFEPVPVTFGGRRDAVIPAGAPLLSDPIDLGVPALSQLSVSLYFPDATGPCTCHPGGYQTGFVSPPGDHTLASFEPAARFTNRAFISAVEIESTPAVPVIVALGDSITDGAGSTVNANRRWPDLLARRLEGRVGIANQGLSGNRVLAHELPVFGEGALARFDRDVLSVSGARWLVVLEGINDIGHSKDDPPSAAEITAGYRQLIDRARARGLKVYGATLPPYEGARYFAEVGEAVRQEVNGWIRTSGAFDGVIDFDAATRDPANPRRMKADLHSGDWLHPSDAGYAAMAEAIDLDLFK
jgi:lysophospholipase L1-like esterase